MLADGSALAANNNVTLTATQLPMGKFGYFLASQTSDFIPNPGGSEGNLCIFGNIGRYTLPGQIQSTGATNSISLVLDLTQTPQPNGTVSVLAGEIWYFQCWHRDTVGGTSTSNLTDGIEITFQ